MSSIDLSVLFVRLFSILASIRAAYAAVESAENVRDALRRGLTVAASKDEVYAAAKAAYDAVPGMRQEVSNGIETMKEHCSYLRDEIEAWREAKEDKAKMAARARLGKLFKGVCGFDADLKYREAGEIIKSLD